jgi:transposase
VRSVEAAQQNLVELDVVQDIEKVVAVKGYHKAQNLVQIHSLPSFGIKTYIPEPQSKYERVWTDKPASQKRAVYHNRDRCSRDHGKALQRRRSEVVERSFAHLCETGGSRRSWLTGIDNVRKRYSLAAAAHNLGLILRQLIGSSKPRGFAALGWLLRAAQMARGSILKLWSLLTRPSPPIWKIPSHNSR